VGVASIATGVQPGRSGLCSVRADPGLRAEDSNTMSKQPGRGRANASAAVETARVATQAPERRVTRADTLIALMRADGGATAAELGEAVGWQVHSVRGFIAGTVKKRADLTVTAIRTDGVMRYRVVDVEGAAS
jgi:hypothetical protein